MRLGRSGFGSRRRLGGPRRELEKQVPSPLIRRFLEQRPYWAEEPAGRKQFPMKPAASEPAAQLPKVGQVLGHDGAASLQPRQELSPQTIQQPVVLGGNLVTGSQIVGEETLHDDGRQDPDHEA